MTNLQIGKWYLHVRLLISCPGDADYALAIAKEVVDDFNRNFSEHSEIFFVVSHWHEDSVPGSGAPAQTLLNKQLVKECDAVIAVFNKRYGTKTERYDSGTEEEIFETLKLGKKAYVYFKTNKMCSNPSDDQQKMDVLKKRLQEENVYYKEYDSKDGLSAGLKRLLAKISLEAEQEKEAARSPEIKLQTISNNKFWNTLVEMEIDLSGFFSLEKTETNIIEKYNDLLKCDLAAQMPHETKTGHASPLAIAGLGAMASMETPYLTAGGNTKVQLSDNNQQVITAVLKKLGIEAQEDLFYLGNLKERQILYGYDSSLSGTQDEQDKYRKLNELRDLSYYYLEAFLLIDSLSDCVALAFAVANDGTMPDTNIEVEIRFPSGTLLEPDQLPIPGSTLLEIIDGELPQQLFEIEGTDQYREYYESCTSPRYSNAALRQPVHTVLSGSFTPAYDEEYYKTDLDSIFEEYEFVETSDGSNCIIARISFDEVKHKKKYAFPTVLFVKKNSIESLHYSIRSDSSSELFTGVIKADNYPNNNDSEPES